MLEIRSVQKSYGTFEAVSHVNLTIPEGSFFSLLGPSGCGKTTLLRMIAGLEKPSDGEIYFQGKRVDTLPPHERQFNLVFQKYALFPHLNVFENVAFGLRMKKTEEKEVRFRVQEALTLVQMWPFHDRAVTTLSGGQQQRVALARALINRPKVLLLDEPLSALDLKLRQQMQVELLNLQRQLKITFIFVTHDQDEALTLSDQIAVMNAGKVEQMGTPQEIYEYPKSEFVARFIGSINSFQGSVSEASSDQVMVSAQFKKPFVVKPSRDGARPLPALSLQNRVHLMVRPEKLRILKSAPNADQNGIEGVLRDILYQGPVTQFMVVAKDQPEQVLTVSQPNTALTSRKAFNPGDKVFVAWAPEDGVITPAS